MRLGTIRVNNQLKTHFFNVFISLLYMFRATQCSSPGESIVSIHHLVYITLCRWPSGMQVREFLSDLHIRRSPSQSDIYQMMYWYNLFSWWWTLGCSKHVKKWNKHIKKCVTLVINMNCQISYRIPKAKILVETVISFLFVGGSEIISLGAVTSNKIIVHHPMID